MGVGPQYKPGQEGGPKQKNHSSEKVKDVTENSQSNRATALQAQPLS